MFCVSCGAQIPEGSSYCGMCGSEVKSGDADAFQQPSRPSSQAVSEYAPKRGAFKGAIAAVVSAAIVAVVGGGACFALGVFGNDPLFGADAGREDAVVRFEEAAPEEEAAEYSYETVALERYGSDYGPNSGQLRFSYVQITSSQPNAKVDELNAAMKAEAEEAYEKKMTDEVYSHPTQEQLEETYYSHFNYGVSYFEDGTVCIMRLCGSLSPGAVHDLPYNQSSVVNLDTGEEASAVQFVGIPEDDLRAMAWDAVDAYLPTTNQAWNSAREAFGDASLDGVVPEGAAVYYLSPDGVVALFEPYTLGPYAMGTPGLLVCDYAGNAVAQAEDYPLQTEEFGKMRGKTQAQLRDEEAERQAAEQAAEKAEERLRLEREEQLAARKAENEQTALSFASRFYTNMAVASPDDDMQILDTDSAGEWSEGVQAYLEPGSDAQAKFQSDMLSGPIMGLGAGSIAKDAEVVSSDEGAVAVRVTYVLTQNPYPGWSNDTERFRSTVFVCSFAESGLISAYEMEE